jgi:hypothetical protein
MAKQVLPKKFNVKLHYGQKIHIQVIDKRYSILETGEAFDDFSKAYSAAHNHKNSSLTFFKSKEIAMSDPERYQDFGTSILDTKTRRMFVSYDEEQTLKELLDDFLFFKTIAKGYRKDKKNFYRAYNFLTYHPLFWKIEGDINRHGSLTWNINEGLEDAWHTVYKGKNRKVVHLLEIGEYLSEEIEYYNGETILIPSRIPRHDAILDSVGSTYEEVIIRLAGRVNKFYNSSGILRKKHSK